MDEKRVVDADFDVVGEPPFRPFRIHWFSLAYTLAFYAGCIAIAASNEEPATRGAAAFGAATFGPIVRFFGQMTQTTSEREARQLRRRLLRRED